MKLRNSLYSIAGVILASSICASAFATTGQLHGSGCHAQSQTSGVNHKYWGIENKNTNSSVTIVCPMNLSGSQGGNKGGPLTRLDAYVTNPSTSTPVKCRFAIRDEKGKYRLTTGYSNATSTGDYVQITSSTTTALPDLSGDYMIAECVLPKYSGSGNPPTIRSVRAD